MLNFGGYVQKYGKYMEDKLANSELNEPLDDVAVVIPEEQQLELSGAVDGVKFSKTSLYVTGLVTIKVKLDLDEGNDIQDYTFTANGKTVTPVLENGVYVLKISGISPADFDTKYHFSISDGTDVQDLEMSALSYAKYVLDHVQDDADWTNAMKALYLYNAAIDAYAAQ